MFQLHVKPAGHSSSSIFVPQLLYKPINVGAAHDLARPVFVKTLNLHEAAAFLHMHPQEVRARAKRGLIPGAKPGKRWVFLEDDLAEFVRSLYPARPQEVRVRQHDANAYSVISATPAAIQREYEELVMRPTRGARRKASGKKPTRILRVTPR